MIPKHLTALANHKGAAILHAGGMLIPVKIMDIEHEESIYAGSKTTFKGLVVDASSMSPAELVKSAKTVANSAFGAQCYKWDPNVVTRPANRCIDDTWASILTPEILQETIDRLKNPAPAAYHEPVGGNLTKVTEPRHTPCVIRETCYDIENVGFTATSTTVFWKDGTMTEIVYQAGDPALKEHDLALAFSLKAQGIAKVIFNNPHTIVLWGDKTKTIVKCQEGDVYSPETGLFTCIAKKRLGNKGNFNDVFKKHIPNY